MNDDQPGGVAEASAVHRLALSPTQPRIAPGPGLINGGGLPFYLSRPPHGRYGTASTYRLPPVVFHPLQEWEGRIVEVLDNEFVARLLDITAGSSYDHEEATIPFDEIADRDRDKICLGSFFRWVVGYQRFAVGTKRHTSQIVFREFPDASEEERRESQDKADQLWRSLGL